MAAFDDQTTRTLEDLPPALLYYLDATALVRLGRLTSKGNFGVDVAAAPIAREREVDASADALRQLRRAERARVYERFARTSRSLADAENGTAHIVVGNAGNRAFPYHYPNGSVEGFQFGMLSFERFRSYEPSGFGQPLGGHGAGGEPGHPLVAAHVTVLKLLVSQVAELINT